MLLAARRGIPPQLRALRAPFTRPLLSVRSPRSPLGPPRGLPSPHHTPQRAILWRAIGAHRPRSHVAPDAENATGARASKERTNHERRCGRQAAEPRWYGRSSRNDALRYMLPLACLMPQDMLCRQEGAQVTAHMNGLSHSARME